MEDPTSELKKPMLPSKPSHLQMALTTLPPASRNTSGTDPHPNCSESLQHPLLPASALSRGSLGFPVQLDALSGQRCSPDALSEASASEYPRTSSKVGPCPSWTGTGELSLGLCCQLGQGWETESGGETEYMSEPSPSDPPTQLLSHLPGCLPPF
jgi:hypothetical protein